MKKCIGIFAAIAATVMMVSCAKDIAGTEKPIHVDSNLVKLTLDASTSNVKAFLNGKTVTWEVGDELAVYDGSDQLRKFTVVEADGSNAKIEGEVVAEWEVLQLVYPYIAYKEYKDGALNVTIPSEQMVSSYGVDKNALVQVSTITAGNTYARFSNVVSLIKFSIDSENVSSVSLLGKADETFCGEVSVIPGDDIVVSCTDASCMTVKPSEGNFAKGEYYATIAPAVFTKGFDMILETSDGIRFLEAKTENEFVRNGGKDLKTITSSAKTLPYEIGTAEELRIFNHFNKFYQAGETVSLTADIDYSGKTWTPIENLTVNIAGDNHSIKNIQVETASDACLATNLSAAVTDLTIGAASDDVSSFTSTSAYETTSLAPFGTVTESGLLSNITNYASLKANVGGGYFNIGGVCAVYESVSGEPLSNCNNYGSITITGEGGFYCGGVVGVVNSNVNVTDCANYGAITVDNKYTATQGRNQIGGVVGQWHSVEGGSITSCTNNGKILCIGKTFSGKNIYIGGIVSEIYDNGEDVNCYCDVLGCTGNATIENRGRATWIYVGGIVGRCEATLESNIGSEDNPCINNADIVNNGNSSYGTSTSSPVICVGGIIGQCSEAGARTQYCENKGNLKNTGDVNTDKNRLAIGGIAAYYKGTSLKYCSNSGKISDTHAEDGAKQVGNYLGGIVGTMQVEMDETQFTGNQNTGAISCCYGKERLTSETSGVKEWYVFTGGVIGHAAQKIIMDNCSNRGDITDTLFNSAEKICAGGILGYAALGGTTVQNSTVKCTVAGYGSYSIKNKTRGASYKYVGIVVGDIVKNTFYLKNVQVAGKRSGKTITADNWNSTFNSSGTTYYTYLYGYNDASKTSAITGIDYDADCGYLSE